MAAYKKLLVLLDLLEGSEQVAIAARDLAACSDASMLILHVVEFVPVEPLGESLMPTAQIEDELIERSRENLSTLITRLSLPRTTGRVEAGHTKSVILRVAAEERAIKAEDRQTNHRSSERRDREAI